MKVIAINEENHGLIGIAATKKAAFQFLINNHWLTINYDLYDKTTNAWYTLADLFKDKDIEPTKENILAWAMEHVDDWEVWDGAFYFYEEDVYEED